MARYRADWLAKGSQGNVEPSEAIDRLLRAREGYNIRLRKQELYTGGEILFKLPVTVFPELAVCNKELSQCENVFGLYTDGTHTPQVNFCPLPCPSTSEPIAFFFPFPDTPIRLPTLPQLRPSAVVFWCCICSH